MKFKTYAPIIFTLIAILLTAVSVLAETTVISVTEPFEGTGIATERLFRDGTPPPLDCSGKTFPGPFSSGGFPYSVEGPFGPVLEDGCVTIDWDPMTCGTGVHPMVYLNSFDPNWGPDNAANYLGDPGSSAALSFSFPVSAGDNFVLIVQSVSTTAPTCEYSYTFTYNRLPDAPPEPEAPAGCQLTVPEGSVVGDAPFETQVYYEPGNVAPGVVLNPGTYIVLGQDASETYYQVMLACQYLWVRKESMQPSFQPPQNGAALPTNIIEVIPVGEAPTGPANDL